MKPEDFSKLTEISALNLSLLQWKMILTKKTHITYYAKIDTLREITGNSVKIHTNCFLCHYANEKVGYCDCDICPARGFWSKDSTSLCMDTIYKEKSSYKKFTNNPCNKTVLGVLISLCSALEYWEAMRDMNLM